MDILNIKVDIYNSLFLKRDGSPVVNIGGIETLIKYLISGLADVGFCTTVYQCGDNYFETRYDSSTVIGYPFAKHTPVETILDHFRKEALKRAGTKNRIEIFAADHFSVPNDNPLAISIQNGIWWDQPIKALTHKKIFYNRFGETVFRLKKQFQMLHLFENCFNRVCTDLNYVNWYRTCRGNIKGRVWYNPNPAPVMPWNDLRESIHHNDNYIRIIFARRFVRQKGTRLIASVFKSLLRMRSNIQITIAGEGPEKDYLLQYFSGESRVEITSYNIEDVMNVLSEHDISVIPSMLSEATCLAVVEAMAAGCAVIASNVGGITNQIIDGYNGLIAWPNKKSLLDQILKLVDFPEERLRIQKRGWETAQKSFSLDRWKKQWRDILKEVIDGKDIAVASMKKR